MDERDAGGGEGDDAVGGPATARDAGTDTWVATGSLTVAVIVAVLSWLAYRRARSRRHRP